jgi:hypothetical protein
MSNINNSPPSETFCILPWIHLSTRPDGSMRVCCTANASSVGPTNDKEHGGMVGVLKTDEGKPNNLNVSDFLSSWNSNYMRNVRLQMLNGEKPPSCTKCFKEEAAGHRSKRQWETEYWSKKINIQKLIDDTKEDGSVPPKLTYIDLRFGTKCQLACVMCSPHDSSGWIKDWKEIHPQVQNSSLKETMQWSDKGSTNGSSYNWHKNNPVFWEQFYDQIPNMQQIYFAGGESLIIDEHYDILKQCIKQDHARNLEIRYNSNGIEWKQDLFSLWKQFKLVRFHYSIDDIGVRNEYIRYPSNWNRMKEVFNILDTETSDNVEVTVACAVQALNVYYLPDLLRWKLEQNFKKINKWPLGAGGVNFHFVYHPPHLNVKVLPNWFKQKVREKYEEFYQWWEKNWELGLTENQRGKVSYDQWRNSEYGIKRLQGIIQFMESEDWSNRLSELKEYISLIDKQRNLSFEETFYEMKGIF